MPIFEIGGVIENGKSKDFLAALKYEVDWIGAENKPVVIVLGDDRQLRFKGGRVVDREKELYLILTDVEITRQISCDQQTKENDYKLDCRKLSSDDWDENNDPCDGCSHRISKTIVEEVEDVQPR
jgi:hypothetical protein